MFPATVRRKPGCSARRASAPTIVSTNVPQEISAFPAGSLQTAAKRPAAEVLYAVKVAGGGFSPPSTIFLQKMSKLVDEITQNCAEKH
jgi:hypothetical protein